MKRERPLRAVDGKGRIGVSICGGNGNLRAEERDAAVATVTKLRVQRVRGRNIDA